MNALNVRNDACALDFLSLGSLIHRLDPGVIPFRKARSFEVHVSGGEYNVAANLSIAGIGFDDTEVQIVVDPVATRNSHKILAHGAFGRLRAEVENMPNPDNPGTSYLASLSAIATLKRILNPIQIGA